MFRFVLLISVSVEGITVKCVSVFVVPVTNISDMDFFPDDGAAAGTSI